MPREYRGSRLRHSDQFLAECFHCNGIVTRPDSGPCYPTALRREREICLVTVPRAMAGTADATNRIASASSRILTSFVYSSPISFFLELLKQFERPTDKKQVNQKLSSASNRYQEVRC